MNKEQIESLPADRETDALIAVEFFEWRWLAIEINGKKFTACFPPNDVYNISSDIYEVSDDKAERSSDWDKIGWEDVDGELQLGFPHYSIDIESAWEIVDKIAETHHWEIKSPFHIGEKWFVGITPHDCTGWNGRPDFQASADTAPLAICRAALLWKFNQENK